MFEFRMNETGLSRVQPRSGQADRSRHGMYCFLLFNHRHPLSVSVSVCLGGFSRRPINDIFKFFQKIDFEDNFREV